MNYKDSGVDIDEAMIAIEKFKPYIKKSYNSNVLSNVGSYGGMFDISNMKDIKNPVLVSSTDSIGTKIDLARLTNKFSMVGYDIVNHCINDILVQGAKPLFFLDYLGLNKCNSDIVAEIVKSISNACYVNNCPLLGGEIAELGSVYNSDAIDIVGTIVGIVDKEKIIDGSNIEPGNIIIGLESTGLHTNGYTLATKALTKHMKEEVINDLLVPHKCYLADINYLNKKDVKINGLVHITGGGFYDNPSRILKKGLGCKIKKDSWDVNDIFKKIQYNGDISEKEMYRVFNMGIGMFVIVDKKYSDKALDLLPFSYEIGEIIESDNTITFY